MVIVIPNEQQQQAIDLLMTFVGYEDGKIKTTDVAIDDISDYIAYSEGYFQPEDVENNPLVIAKFWFNIFIYTILHQLREHIITLQQIARHPCFATVTGKELITILTRMVIDGSISNDGVFESIITKDSGYYRRIVSMKRQQANPDIYRIAAACRANYESEENMTFRDALAMTLTEMPPDTPLYPADIDGVYECFRKVSVGWERL